VTAPVFYLDPDVLAAAAEGDVVRLDGDEGRHAADVRRMRVGEQIVLTDGGGTALDGVVAEAGRGQISVDVRTRRQDPRLGPRVTVVQALARGGRDEQAVELMTELGADEFIGWPAERAVARWTDRTAARWAATARSAAKQSRRIWWPTVSGPASAADVAAVLGAADAAYVLHERASLPLAGEIRSDVASVAVVVGPEGGLTDDEVAVLSAAGGVAVRLGSTVLRSSSAGAAALAVIYSRTRWA
jgi:16S rRNA (uracil1498-N3)-methyltransferase